MPILDRGHTILFEKNLAEIARIGITRFCGYISDAFLRLD